MKTRDQLIVLGEELRLLGFETDLSYTDRLRITHVDREIAFWVAANNDGRDRFYELRDQSGIVTTVDLPVETDLLVDQLVSFL